MGELVEAAKKYLKDMYGEETVSMEVTKNSVVDGNGELHVDCTVKVSEMKSDWSKVFRFREGKIVDMSARIRR